MGLPEPAPASGLSRPAKARRLPIQETAAGWTPRETGEAAPGIFCFSDIFMLTRRVKSAKTSSSKSCALRQKRPALFYSAESAGRRTISGLRKPDFITGNEHRAPPSSGFLFFGHFFFDPTGEICENIIVEELRAAAETPGAFLLRRIWCAASLPFAACRRLHAAPPRTCLGASPLSCWGVPSARRQDSA